MSNDGFDPCRQLPYLNLNYRTHQIKILKRDKHTRIEGIYTEKRFEQEIIAPSFSQYSTGWWFAKNAGSYRIYKLMFGDALLSELDFSLLQHFHRHRVPIVVVGFHAASKSFHGLPFRHHSKSDFVRDWHLHQSPLPRPDTVPALPNQDQRNALRLQRAIQLLEGLEALKATALERIFANCFLREKYCWDLDGMVLHNGQPVALEVKQKFPHKGGSFGLNNGLYNLFCF
ncbi:MAG: hypothetical protein AAFP02_25310, partial [Bacteroidota bacterium]